MPTSTPVMGRRLNDPQPAYEIPEANLPELHRQILEVASALEKELLAFRGLPQPIKLTWEQYQHLENRIGAELRRLGEPKTAQEALKIIGYRIFLTRAAQAFIYDSSASPTLPPPREATEQQRLASRVRKVHFATALQLATDLMLENAESSEVSQTISLFFGSLHSAYLQPGLYKQRVQQFAVEKRIEPGRDAYIFGFSSGLTAQVCTYHLLRQAYPRHYIYFPSPVLDVEKGVDLMVVHPETGKVVLAVQVKASFERSVPRYEPQASSRLINTDLRPYLAPDAKQIQVELPAADYFKEEDSNLQLFHVLNGQPSDRMVETFKKVRHRMSC